MRLSTLSSNIFALLKASILGLIAGTLWILLAIFLGLSMIWLTLPIGGLIGYVIRGRVHGSRLYSAILSAYAILVAILYVSGLKVIVQLASVFGIGLSEAMHGAGLRLLTQLIWLNSSYLTLSVDLLAILLAMAISFHKPANAKNTSNI